MTNIVLCGSMKVKDKILEVANQLEEKGYNVLLPVECMKDLDKIVASRSHLDRICNPDTDIVLIVNATKNNIENYAKGKFKNQYAYITNDHLPPEEHIPIYDLINQSN